jgi:hypothetical protein
VARHARARSACARTTALLLRAGAACRS